MNNKKCPSCNIIKPLDNFYKGGGKCKPCQHSYNKIHNKVNKDIYKKYQKKSSKKCYDRGQEFMDRVKSIYGCIKCGERRFWVIDYHHKNPKSKTHPIPWYKTSTIDIIKKEIRKCVPLCRNCHMDFHYLEKINNITIEKYLE
jgi:hypothetical protein